jgi:hypothetical protein
MYEVTKTHMIESFAELLSRNEDEALVVIASLFVAAFEDRTKREGGDINNDIIIESPTAKKITIHSKKG